MNPIMLNITSLSNIITRPPPPPPTRPPPPPPTRPPPPPTRPPPPPTTRSPPTRPPTRPPPPPTTLAPLPAQNFRQAGPDGREPKSSVDADNNAVPVSAHQTVNSQFSQFPNFQNHLQSSSKDFREESPRQSQAHEPRAFHTAKLDNDVPKRNFLNQHNSKSSDRKNNERNFRNQKNDNKRNQNKFNNNRDEEQKKEPNRDRNRESSSSTEPHSPTSSSGLTIEEFLTRYPEVKRLSSRFGDDVPNTESPFKSHNFKKHNKKNKKNKSHKSRPQSAPESTPQQHTSFTAFSAPETTPATQPPRITPRQRQTPAPTRPPPTRPPPSRPAPTQPKQEFIQTTQRPRSNKQKSNNRHNNNNNNNVQQFPAYDDYSIDSLDYDYYYDQLVPEHERFFQLPKTDDATPAPFEEKDNNNNGGFQVFTHFNNDQQSQIETRPKPTAAAKQKTRPKPHKPKSLGGGSKSNSVGPPINKPGGPQAGPFGYTDKGTYFEDSHFDGFPERIEMIYQGFVWAMEMFYPGQDSVFHGGVHTILEDKVKRETVNLEGDYIVRVTGRASPYNINRLTFHTKNGKQFGPWGDRHSEDSVDFDVSAPPGQALAFFSGTIDFGVPLRSVSFHWRPIS